MPATADHLINALLTDTRLVAIRLQQTLRPLVGSTVYPASYAPPENAGRDAGPRYCITELREGHNVCVIDSIPSQANRIEAALHENDAYKGLIADVRIQAKLADGSIGERHMLELGHRATDGAVLASSLEPEITEALKQARADARALAMLSPMSLLLGVWDSRKNRTGLKLPRAFSATIEASDVSVRTRHAQYNSAWHANELEADLQVAAGSKPSEIGLDGAISGDGLGGVEAFGAITRSAFIATTPLRSNLVLDSDKAKAPDDSARYVAALGLVALTMPASPWLRSGCNLIPSGPAHIEAVYVDGTVEPLQLTHEAAKEAAHMAAEAFGVKTATPKLGILSKEGIERVKKSTEA